MTLNKRPANSVSAIAALAIILLFPACQKCETCSYSHPVGNGKQETYTFPEVCGDKMKRDAQEDACRTAAAMAGTTCKCSKS